jgi:hypothetical protein
MATELGKQAYDTYNIIISVSFDEEGEQINQSARVITVDSARISKLNVVYDKMM